MGPQPLPLAFIANKDLFTPSVAFCCILSIHFISLHNKTMYYGYMLVHYRSATLMVIYK